MIRLDSGFVIALALGQIATSAEDSPLGLADLAAYRSALATKAQAATPRVRFLDLWDRPSEYAGRSVRVEGRVARIFRQPKFEEFPPLVEAWAITPAGDPLCLVFAATEGRPAVEIGASVEFTGTFLRRIKYQGGDVPRLAPLIVGPEPPAVMSLSAEISSDGWSSADWMMAVGGGLIVGLFLMRRHLSRPTLPRRPDAPPPSFVDGDQGLEEDSDEA